MARSPSRSRSPLGRWAQEGFQATMPKSWGKGGKKGKGGLHEAAGSDHGEGGGGGGGGGSSMMDPAYEAARMAAEMVLRNQNNLDPAFMGMIAPMTPMTPGANQMAAGVRVAPPPPTEIFGKGGPGDAVRVAPPPAPAEDLDWNTWSE